MNQMLIVCTSGTRPGSQQTGMRIWETDTKREILWDGSSWVTLINKILFVAKGSDEGVASSTTLQPDNDLFLPVEINSTYIMNCTINAINTTDGVGIRINFTTPAGTTIGWTPQAGHTNQTSSTAHLISVNYFTGTGAADAACTYGLSSAFIDITGLVRTGGTSGNLQMQWAQAVSNGNSTFVRGTQFGAELSFLRLEKVA